MELYYKDGITVQARDAAEAAHWLALGYKKVVEPKPEKKPAKTEPENDEPKQ